MLRVKDWSDHFENNRTRDMVRMEWVPFPNKHDGDGFTELMDHPDGVTHFGAWVLIVQVASKCGLPAGRCGIGAVPRGTLLRATGKPYDAKSLARVTGADEKVFAEAIPRLLSIGWLEEIPEIRVETAIPQEGAGAPQEGAEIPQATDDRARGPVPFRSVPFQEGGLGETKTTRPSRGLTQADYDRAHKVAALYPDKASKDNRPIVFSLPAQNLLAVRIAANPEYPWEEHAKLCRSIPTPQDGQKWAEDMPNPVALEKLRKAAAPAAKKEYFTA
jgi:hypothetical protein